MHARTLPGKTTTKKTTINIAVYPSVNVSRCSAFTARCRIYRIINVRREAVTAPNRPESARLDGVCACMQKGHRHLETIHIRITARRVGRRCGESHQHRALINHGITYYYIIYQRKRCILDYRHAIHAPHMKTAT